MFSAGCTMNIGSKKLLREVASTFCGAHPRTGLRDQMENLLLGLPFEEANWPYEELGEELGSHQNRSTMLS